jgi:hypothetical protein
MSEEEVKICTTSGEPVDKVRAEQTESKGQHKAYLVLCAEEREKGFVRPYRDAYKHIGRSICGKLCDSNARLGGPRTICSDEFGHVGACGFVTRVVDQPEHAQIENTHRLGGCGTVTTMGRALSGTYARDPKFYGATFCCGCNVHLPVGEFVWTADDETVGS